MSSANMRIATCAYLPAVVQCYYHDDYYVVNERFDRSIALALIRVIGADVNPDSSLEVSRCTTYACQAICAFVSNERQPIAIGWHRAAWTYSWARTGSASVYADSRSRFRIMADRSLLFSCLGFLYAHFPCFFSFRYFFSICTRKMAYARCNLPNRPNKIRLVSHGWLVGRI